MLDGNDQDQPESLAIELPARPRKKMYRTRAEISSALKSARDIMRKDAGLNGDLDRLPQLSWLLFLRVFSERVDEFRAMEDLDYEPALDEPYRWETWGTNEDFTGDTFLKFVNEDLLPHLRRLRGSGDNDPRNVISAIFQEVNNRMLSGTLLRDLVNIVDRIDFQADESVHTMAHVYESIMKEMRDAAGDSGEFYTPRPVIKFMVEQSFLNFGESVMDPACGTGGFLVEAFEKLKPHAMTSIKLAQLHNNIRGIEKKPLPYLLCMMNLLLHDVDTPRVVRDNALIRMRNETSPKYRVDVILTNPPFGGEEEGSVAERFPKGYATRETAWLFLHSVIERLKPGGRCAIVLPNNSLSDSRASAIQIKEKLMKECELHTIVRLPQGVFAPYTRIPANLLFFEKAGPTKETWFYEIPCPKDRRGYTKTKPMRHEEFADCAEWWGGEDRKGRKVNGCAWKVAAEIIKSKRFNLAITNPRDEKSQFLSPSTLITTIGKNLSALNESTSKFADSSMISANWTPLGDFLIQESDFVEVLSENKYRTAGIYSHGRGLFERPTIYGFETNYKKFNRLHAGQFVYSKPFGWEGALAVVTPEFEGIHVSHEFPTFKVDARVVDLEYVAHLARWPGLHAALKDQGAGMGSRRQHVNVDRLLSTKVPLPSLTEQRRIAQQLSAILLSEKLTMETAKLLGQLHSSVLDSTVKSR
jgi:type I restriction enzyme M protein